MTTRVNCSDITPLNAGAKDAFFASGLFRINQIRRVGDDGMLTIEAEPTDRSYWQVRVWRTDDIDTILSKYSEGDIVSIDGRAEMISNIIR